jgi:hypothetical protein
VVLWVIAKYDRLDYHILDGGDGCGDKVCGMTIANPHFHVSLSSPPNMGITPAITATFLNSLKISTTKW